MGINEPLPEPDSRAYRALVLKGRMDALNDLGNYIVTLNERLDAASDGETGGIMIENWRHLLVWMEEAGREVQGDLEILKSERPRDDSE